MIKPIGTRRWRLAQIANGDWVTTYLDSPSGIDVMPVSEHEEIAQRYYDMYEDAERRVGLANRRANAKRKETLMPSKSNGVETTEVTPVEHNVAVWCAKQQNILWSHLDSYQRNVWVEKAREVLRVVWASLPERREAAANAAFEAKGRELSYTEEQWLDAALDAMEVFRP